MVYKALCLERTLLCNFYFCFGNELRRSLCVHMLFYYALHYQLAAVLYLFMDTPI